MEDVTLDLTTCSQVVSDNKGWTVYTHVQSTPEHSQTPTVLATPASIKLYCGYAYESGIISERYSLAISAAEMFAVGVLCSLCFCAAQTGV